MMKNLPNLIVFYFLSSSFLLANIIYVPADTSTIQGGITKANPGDTVLVAEGLYFENPEINNKPIVLASYFLLDGDTSHISKTIIDGSQPTVTDSATTVVIRFNPEKNPVLCGFTITGGYGTVVSDGGRVAGGIAVIGSNAIIEHNIITGNIIDYNTVPGGHYPGAAGAGIYIFPLFYNDISVIIRDNIIKNNKVEGDEKSGGGGLMIQEIIGLKNFSFLVERNIIETNTVKNLDDWKAMGGGVQLELAIPTSGDQIIRNNIIRRNRVECEHSFGGGMYVVFVENKAEGNVDNSPGPFIYNNIIANNHSDYSGGGVAFFRIYRASPNSPVAPLTSIGKYIPKPAFINNSIVNNTAPVGAGIFTMNHIPFFMNNILWNSCNPDAEWGEIFIGNVDRWLEKNLYGDIEIYYSDIQGSWEGKGNIDAYPAFVDTAKGDYTLTESSKCIGSGIDSIQINSLWYYCPSSDYNGNPRPNPVDLLEDIGALESEFPSEIEEELDYLPKDFSLKQNYPNPFNPLTTVEYQLPQTSQVDLSIYNILGQKVTALVSAKQPAGSYKVKWDARGFASGVYFYRLKSNSGFFQSKKLLLLK